MLNIILLNLLLFNLLAHHVLAQVKSRDIPDSVFDVNPNVTYPKIYYYDMDGILHLNGTFPGDSRPIVIDYKTYRLTCTSNVYFTFTFIPKERLNEVPACRRGMTVCYESQLDNEAMVMPAFRVKNVNNSVARACERLNDGDRRAHGFNLAFIAPFYRLKLSYTNNIYVFRVPDTKDGIVNLQIGTPKSLMTRVIDSNGEELEIKGIVRTSDEELSKEAELKLFLGTAGDAQMEPPDTENSGRYSASAGLWTLYLDFKSHHTQMQVIQAIHYPDCDMEAIVRGNKMQRCRSWMEDLAVTEPVDTELTFVYTHETGVIHREEKGHENLSELKTKILEQKLQKMIDKSVFDYLNKTSAGSSGANSMQKTSATENSESKGLYYDTSGKLTVQFGNPENGSSGGFNVGGGAKGNDINKKSGKTNNDKTSGSTGSTTTSMYNEVKKSSSLMEAFSNTMGTAQTLSQSEMMSSTSAFSSREAIDVEVTLPPNSKLILQQLMFECDGNVIKMPRIDFTDGKKEVKLPNSTASKPRHLQLDPDLKPNMESVVKMHEEAEREEEERQKQRQEEDAKKTAAVESINNDRGGSADLLSSSSNHGFEDDVVNRKPRALDWDNTDEEESSEYPIMASNSSTETEENEEKEENHDFGTVSFDELATVMRDKEKEL